MTVYCAACGRAIELPADSKYAAHPLPVDGGRVVRHYCSRTCCPICAKALADA